MSKIKENIPTKEVLQEKLHSIMESGLTDFIKTTNAQRIAVQANRRFVAVSVFFIAAISLFLFLSQVDVNTFAGKFIVMTSLLWATVLLISGRGWFISSSLLAREVNMALVPILANTFNRTLLYTYNENATDSIADMLADSGLLLHESHDLKVRNVYTVFSDFDMRVHEISFSQNQEDGANKKVTSNATFIDVNMKDDQDSTTFLFTKGSRYGFSDTAQNQQVKENNSLISLDIPAENVFAYSTSAEARDFVTEAFITVLSDWGDVSKVNIRMVRKGTKLYILVPANKESTRYTSTSTKQEAIERYAQVIAQPVWRALMLAEEMV